jgi:hypothetical protein
MSIAPHAPRRRYAGRSSRGYTLVSNAFADSGKLNPNELAVWQWFKSKSWGDGPVTVEMDYVARARHLSKRMAQHYKQRLIAKGCLIETLQFDASGRQLASAYEAVENLQSAGGGRVKEVAPQVLSTTQKAKDIEPPAARPAPPHRSPNRNIVASSRIARQFCEERRITLGWYRLNITRRTEALLNTGHEEAAIVAQFDREREAAAAPRKIPRWRMLERARLAMRMREGQNPCTWPAAPAAELLENKAEEEEAERPAAPPRVWRSAAQSKAAEERHAESRCRWKWFDERIQTDGAVYVEGRMCRTDEDILAVIRWLVPRNYIENLTRSRGGA